MRALPSPGAAPLRSPEAVYAAERGDAAAVERFNKEIANNEAVGRMAEAAEEMKFKGYDLGRIAEE
jgi:hypothetical protein